MSKQANKTLIGGFVLGALVLVVIGVLIFGSGKFLQERNKYVMYFDGSLKGLNVGSSVIFRGVKIGSVTDININVDPKKMEFHVPVYIEIDPYRIELVGAKKRFRSLREQTKILVERGMRAQLEMQSLVTGQLVVALDFHPDKPAKLLGLDLRYPEIPTIPTDLEELVKKVEKIPVEAIFDKLLSAVEGIEKVVNSPEVMEAIRSFNQTMAASRDLVRNLDENIDPLASNIGGAVTDARKLIRNLDSRVGPVTTSIDNTARAAEAVVVQAGKTLAALEESAGEDSPVIYELNNTLRELSASARSIRLLADYLNRHPESLLYGKGGK